MIDAAFRQCLMELDVGRLRSLAFAVHPLVPQPVSDDALIVGLHQSRTKEQTIPPKYRYYSHCWLVERGLPSFLPDRLKAPAERMYPKVVDAVAIATRTNGEEALMIRGVMEYAVNDCYANGDRDPLIVKPQMMEARARERKALCL